MCLKHVNAHVSMVTILFAIYVEAQV